MQDDVFPSGTWVGFFREGRPGLRDGDMSLELRFSNGAIDGFGADPVGRFAIRGRYDAEGGTVAFLKRYVAAHDVDYSGRGNRRRIVGRWSLGGGVGGEFVLWPARSGGLAKAEVEELLVGARAPLRGT